MFLVPCFLVIFNRKYSYNRVSCFPNPVTIELEVTTRYPSRSRAFRICERRINGQHSRGNFLICHLLPARMLQVSDFSISLPARMGERTQPACLRCPRSPAGRTPSPPGAASRGGSTHAQKPTCENSNEWLGHYEQSCMQFFLLRTRN